MKLPAFFLLVLCAINVAAFGISGAYERMFYWYAYQLDQASDGQKIMAKNCAKDVGSGGKCNLRQFLTYIAKDDKQANLARQLPDTINEPNINVDRAAGILDDGKVNGLYEEHHVCEEVYNVPNLFKKVSQLISKKTKGKSVNDDPLRQILTARKRIQDMRVAETQIAAGEWLRNKYDPKHKPTIPEDGRRGPFTEGLVIETSKRVCKGNDLTYNAVDLQRAGRKISEDKPSNAGESGFNLKTELRAWKEEESGKQNNHIGNIQAIKAAKKTIVKTCSK